MCSHVEGCRSGSFSKNFRSGGSAEFCIRTEVCVLRTKVRVLGSVLLSETNNQRRKKSPSHQSDGSVMRGGHCYCSWEQRGEAGEAERGEEGGGREGKAERGGGQPPRPPSRLPLLLLSGDQLSVHAGQNQRWTVMYQHNDRRRSIKRLVCNKTWSWRTF